jgi:vitamin B12 transporter
MEFTVYIFLAATLSVADNTEPYETTVIGDKAQESPLKKQRRLDAKSPGFATAIDLEDQSTPQHADALPDILKESVGAQTRSIGGLGQFTSLSLRGSSAQQVSFHFEGIPLDGSLDGVTNLSDLPTDSLGEIQIYRGYIPTFLGGRAIGGAVNLVGRLGAKAQNSIKGGWGSFGARQIKGHFSHPLNGTTSIAGALGYAGANGDFSFYDSKNTPTFTDDDTFTRRRNNHYNRLVGYLGFYADQDPWKYSIQHVTYAKKQGIPGNAAAQSSQSQLDTLGLRLLGSATRKRIGPGGYLKFRFGSHYHRSHYQDPLMEAGIGHNDDLTQGGDLFFSPELRFQLYRGAFLNCNLQSRYEHVSTQSDTPTPLGNGQATRQRLSYGVGLDIKQFLFNNRLIVVPGLRLDMRHSYFAQPEGEGEVLDLGANHRTMGFSPRIALRFQVFPALEVRASIAQYDRPPTLSELFGDRGYQVGNEGLVSEKGLSFDAGLITQFHVGSHEGYWHAAFFGQLSENLIAWIPTAGRIRPDNIQKAKVLGFESSLQAHFWRKRIRLSANYTFMYTENGSPEQAHHGQALPGRPRHDVVAKLNVGESWILQNHHVTPRCFGQFSYIADNALDPANRLVLPPRQHIGAGAEISIRPTTNDTWKARIALSIRNLTNQTHVTWSPPIANTKPRPIAVSDFLGYPLPGRSFWLESSFTF